jgi:hypothetical protein
MVHIRSTSESAVPHTSAGSFLKNAEVRSPTRCTRVLREFEN